MMISWDMQSNGIAVYASCTCIYLSPQLEHAILKLQQAHQSIFQLPIAVLLVPNASSHPDVFRYLSLAPFHMKANKPIPTLQPGRGSPIDLTLNQLYCLVAFPLRAIIAVTHTDKLAALLGHQSLGSTLSGLE